ncbi:MAG: hypothetical protein BMS9Abin29_2046 [Gemmatimonadota bacterium]|nr:MAG: hypothetical protein BMS9Abin29_2046 [Gemmatimonadota bacterium]
MMVWRNSARMPTASGRSLFRGLMRHAALVSVTIGTATCASVAATPEGAGPSEQSDIPIVAGTLSAGQEMVAARLLARAESALADGDVSAALSAAREVVVTYPQAQRSSRALWILAQAAFDLSDADQAMAAAVRYLRLLGPDDARRSSTNLLLGQAAQSLGRVEEAFGYFLSIDPSEGAEILDPARGALEAGLSRLDDAALASLIAGADPNHVLLAPLLARYAVDRYVRSDEDEARRLARWAIRLGAVGRTRERAEAVLSGDLSDLAVAPVIGAILPTSGSPRLREFAERIQQGVRVALQLNGGAVGNRGTVELTVLDDRGNPALGPSLLRDLEAAGVLGVIGPLQEASLDLVAKSRSAPLALISPTAPTVPSEAGSVYSLAAAEPGAARALAAYAADNGLTTAALLYPRNRDATFEAEAFREAYEARGGIVLGDLTYVPGTTYFEAHLRTVERLLPSVLVLPIPLRDIELLAPQVTFFGLDSLEVRVMGTAAWARPETLKNIDPRHLNGVIVASAQPAETRIPGLERFVEAYEDMNQHSLRSSVPALGYDAASLLLEAVRLGARTPTQLTETLGTIRGFEGATGVLSVSDGRIIREHYLACIQDGALRTVPEGMIPVPIRVDPLPDPETDSIPEGPGRIVGFRCPEFGMIIDSMDVRSGPSGQGES